MKSESKSSLCWVAVCKVEMEESAECRDMALGMISSCLLFGADIFGSCRNGVLQSFMRQELIRHERVKLERLSFMLTFDWG